jgi:hypothetical protein
MNTTRLVWETFEFIRASFLVGQYVNTPLLFLPVQPADQHSILCHDSDNKNFLTTRAVHPTSSLLLLAAFPSPHSRSTSSFL